jgi:hypothetical protein
MSVSTTRSSGVTRAPNPSGLYDVLDLILDKGLVIDIYVRVSLVGIELLTIDARIVVASVDTYLRFAEAVNRLDLTETGGKDLTEFVGDLTEKGAKGKTGGAIEGAKEKVSGIFSSDDDDEDEGDEGSSSSRSSSSRGREPARRRRTSSSSEDKPRRRRRTSSSDDDE